MIRIEYRPIATRARSAGTWKRRFQQAKRAVVTYATVHCDRRISELATCPRKIFTGEAKPDVAREVATEAGWECHAESNTDFCPRHRSVPPVPS